MSRRSKSKSPRRSKRTKAEKRQRLRDDQRQFGALVRDTAGVYTCSSETASNFKHHCEGCCGDLDSDLAFARLAHEIWADQQGPVQQLALTLAALVAEQQRHFDAMTRLAKRFAELADLPELEHLHLGEAEDYHALVWRRIFSTVPPPQFPLAARRPPRQRQPRTL